MILALFLGVFLGQELPPEPLFRVKEEGYPAGLAFLPEGDRLFSVRRNWKETAHLWDLATGKERFAITGDTKGDLSFISLSADGTTVVGVYASIWVRAWSASSGEQISEFMPGGTTSDLVVSSDGKFVTCRHRIDGKFFLYDRATGKWTQRYDHGDQPEAFAFSPDRKLLLSAGGNQSLRLWDVEAGRNLWTMRTPERFVGHRALFSPDGELVVTIGRDHHSVQCCRVSDGQEVPLLPADADQVQGMAFSHDGRLLAWSTKEGLLRLLELASGREVLRWKVGAGEVAFSRSSRHLALSGPEESLVWKLAGDEAGNPKPEELETLWARLALEDGEAAYRAVRTLAAGGPPAAAFLRKRLLEPSLTPERLTMRVSELSQDDVALREKAFQELEDGAHDPALWRALDGVKAGEVEARVKMLVERQRARPLGSSSLLRRCRAIWSLEMMGAVDALEEISKGPIEARQAVEAAMSVKRLKGAKP